jgi:pimeloyl-ACP methyl ester carboxylesterase
MTGVSVRKGYVDGRFGQIHYRIAKPDLETTRRPLLCFHMSPYSSIIYEAFLSEMGLDRMTIAMDTPGFGESDPPSTPPEISDYAGAAADLMNALNLSSVDVMGYHTGSKVALEVALQNPTVVNCIVMVSAPLYTDDELAEVRREYGPEPLSEDGSHVQAWWQSAVRWSMDGRTLDDIGRVFWAKLLNPAISWWGHNAAFSYDSAGALSKVTSPILVLRPEDDVWDATARANGLLVHPDRHIHDLPGWSHGFLDLKTVEAAVLIRGFLDKD